MGDFLYAFTNETSLNSKDIPLILNIRETSYLIFMICITLFFSFKLKKNITDNISKTIIAATFITSMALNIHFNALNTAAWPNISWLMCVSWTYALAKSLCLGFFAVAVLRSNRLDAILLYQAFLYIFIADIALMYQVNTGVDAIQKSFFFKQAWQIGLAIIACIFIKNRKDPNFLALDTVSFFSLRTLLVIAICIVVTPFYYGLFLSFADIKDAQKLTNIIFASYMIFFAANLFSYFISKKFMDITQIIKSNRIFDLSGANREFKFASISKPSRLSELAHFSEEYNLMARNANVLLDAYLAKSKQAGMAQTTQMLAHDIRKPFSQLQVILDQFDIFKTDPAQLDSAKKEIRQSIRNIEAMLNDIMNYSREAKVDTKAVSLVPIMDFSIRQTGASIKAHEKTADIRIEYEFKHTFKPLMDEERMARVFCNIISNAIEAISILGKQNTGSIWIKTRDIPSSANNGAVEITLGNDGPCFQTEDLPKLFHSFFTKGKKNGTGLGLASVEKIVSLHGGTISAHNEANGRGVAFTLSLPASTNIEDIETTWLPLRLSDVLPHVAKVDKKENLETSMDECMKALRTHNGAIKVLIIEDEALYRISMKNVLNHSDLLSNKVILHEADTVEKALNFLEKEKGITHAIVDIDLGTEKNGFDFIRLAKARFPALECMVHTNRCMQEDKTLAEQLGAAKFTSKPLGFETFAMFLAKHLIEKPNSDYPAGPTERFNTPVSPSDNTESWPLRCFVAEDSHIMRLHWKSLLNKAFKDKNPHIEVFETPEAMLKAIKEQGAPDLALSDYHFDDKSHMTGVDLLTRVKAINPRAKLFLVSAIDGALGKSLAQEHGLSGFLPLKVRADDIAAACMDIGRGMIFRDCVTPQ